MKHLLPLIAAAAVLFVAWCVWLPGCGSLFPAI